MEIGPGIGVAGSRCGSFNWASHLYNEGDLALRFDSRSGSNLIDSISGETATILTPCFLKKTSGIIWGNKTGDAEKCFDGNDYTYYAQFRQVEDVGGNYIFSFGMDHLNGRGIRALNSTDRFRIYFGDGTQQESAYLISSDMTATLKNQGVFELFMTIDATAKILYAAIYDTDGNVVGVEANEDISAFAFNGNDNDDSIFFNSDFIVFDNFKKFLGKKTLEQCQTDSYKTGLQIHLANLAGSIDISGNGNDFYNNFDPADEIVYHQMNNWLLDYGYALYYDSSMSFHRTVPNNTDMSLNEPNRTGGMPYTSDSLSWEALGGGICKLMDAKIRFSNAFFDRSNVTIWNDDCRAADHYDSDNPKDFHITELNQRILMSWLNNGYRGRLYINMNPNSVVTNLGGDAMLRDASDLIEILLYNNDNKGINNAKILQYTGDYIAEVLSGGQRTYDDDNYIQLGVLKTTKGMFTIRVDDGYQNAYDSWRGVFNALEINPSMNIHSQIVGTSVGGHDFMSWDNIKTLISEGWEITSSGQYDNDWNAVTQTVQEAEVADSKSDIEAEGITCNHLIPNKYGQALMSSRYFAKKHGYKTCHCGYIYGSIDGANPQTIDKYNLCAMACDLFVTYNLEDVPNTEEIAAIKAQLDLAKANNAWAIMYIHAYADGLADAITEVINYAKFIGLINTTMDGALENTSYQ